ncbi:Serine/threonine-protein kinase hal4 [Golovinomyces cichoracearum]|uniref:non-specific serine/threonine protein kinase n=1 Tax=Golovinomyces cichoracearum TaxID=62708 RepID=A0A420IK24_9PEZI|nr:Serine/threonine-protein kinase hal4 [Golovinomyces cichoracearum]
MSTWTFAPVSRIFSVRTYDMASVSGPRDSSKSIKSHKSSKSAQEKCESTFKPELTSPEDNIPTFCAEKIEDNGLLTPPSEVHIKPSRNSPVSSSEKSSMTRRITRMFSTRDPARSDITVSALKLNNAQRSPRHDLISPFLNSPKSLTRKSSGLEKLSKSEKAEKSATTPTREKKAANVLNQRFTLDPNLAGGHQHFLKSTRRQENLSDMIRNVISGKAARVEPIQEGEQQLSLMSSWVDQLKSERDSMGSDKKSGSNNTATLVEKYGKCQEIVGQGAFGIVRISHKRTEGMREQLYAVKEFRRRPDETEKKYSKRLTSEFCISSSLRHPNVIHTLDLLQDSKGDYCEVMEFCAGGDLYSLVLSTGKLEVAEADCYFKQMIRGVEYMHEMGVAHRDLKPENLLLTTYGSLKITDFGNGECFRMAWESDAHMVTGLCGSAPYIAPEEYTEKEFDARAVDVWATGVIYMAMRTGRHLWRVAKKEDDEFYERYLQGRRDEEGYAPIESLHRARCRNVIYSILDPNPSRRITASQVLRSEWGREIKLCKAGEEGL